MADASPLAPLIDHTLLRADAGPSDVERLCAEALEHGFAAVCVNGWHVARCAERLRDSAVAVCCVVGFPLGAMAPRAKAYEAALAVLDGARELDVVLNLGALAAGDHDLVRRDLGGVVEAAHRHGALVKAILETGLLDRARKVAACELARAAGADFVKTSTGFGPGGATVADVELLRATVGPDLGVKAAGGIRDAAGARALVAAGATRLGTSHALAILEEEAG